MVVSSHIVLPVQVYALGAETGSAINDAAAFAQLSDKVSSLRSIGISINLDRSPLNGCSAVYMDAVKAQVSSSLLSLNTKEPFVQTYIAYGPSGTGKSVTMAATVNCILGIFFDMLQSGSPLKLELGAYEEHLKAGFVSDLLELNKSTGKPTARAFSVSKADGQSFQVKGLHTVAICDMSQAIKTLQIARKRLCKLPTRNNRESSRAHSCIEIRVSSQTTKGGQTGGCTFRLVDLAGHEDPRNDLVLNDQQSQQLQVKYSVRIRDSLRELPKLLVRHGPDTNGIQVISRQLKLSATSFIQNLFYHGICQDTSLIVIATLSPRMKAISASFETLDFVQDVCAIKRTMKVVKKAEAVPVATTGALDSGENFSPTADLHVSDGSEAQIRIQELEQQLLTANEERLTREAEVEEARKQLAEEKMRHGDEQQAMMQELVSARERVDEMSETLNSKEAEVEKLTSSLTRLKERHVALKYDIEAARKEYCNVKSTKKALKEAQAELEACRIRMEDTSGKLKRKTAQHDLLDDSLKRQLLQDEGLWSRAQAESMSAEFAIRQKGYEDTIGLLRQELAGHTVPLTPNSTTVASGDPVHTSNDAAMAAVTALFDAEGQETLAMMYNFT